MTKFVCARDLVESHVLGKEEYIESLILSGVSRDGTYFVITPPQVTIETLQEVRSMLLAHIKELKNEEALN